MVFFAGNAHAFLSDDKARQGLIDLTNKTQSQYQKLFDQQDAQSQALLNLQQELTRAQQQNQELRGLIEQNSNILEQRQALWQKNVKLFEKIDQLEQNQKQLQSKIDEMSQILSKLSVLSDAANVVNGTNEASATPEQNLSNIQLAPTKIVDSTLNPNIAALSTEVGSANKAISATDIINVEKKTNQNRDDSIKIEQAYKTAFEAMKEKQYKQAVDIFKNILEQYPKHEKAPIAQYYLGNCYYLMKSYKLSTIELAKFIKLNPNHPKVPDAYLAIASAQMADNQIEKAKYTLDYITKRFQGLEVAQSAKERLDKLR